MIDIIFHSRNSLSAIFAYHMHIITLALSIHEETLLLTNQKVIYWQREEALILSDWHIGKATHFNQHGIAIPKQTYLDDLHRMESIIAHFCPKKIIVVGDMIHAGINAEVHHFASWRKAFPTLEIILVKGNHDHFTTKLLSNGIVDTINHRLNIAPFIFVHDYLKDTAIFQVNGHIHPGILMKNRISRVRLPCYFVTDTQLLLPAFSDFTGLNVRSIHKKGTAYIWIEDELLSVVTR